MRRKWPHLRGGTAESLRQRSPNFLAPGTDFVEDSFSTNRGWGWDGFKMIQAPYAYHALYFEPEATADVTGGPSQRPGGQGPLAESIIHKYEALTLHGTDCLGGFTKTHSNRTENRN